MIDINVSTKLWNKNFVLLLQGGFVSNLGDAVYSFAIGYYVYQITGSEALLGIFSSITMLTFMLLGPLAGAYADRVNRKKMLVGSDAINGIIMLIIGGLCVAGALSTTRLMLLTVVFAVVSTFFNPAGASVLMDLVPGNELTRARSVQSAAQMIVKMVSKSAGGLLVVLLGVGPLILFNGVSYLFSAFSELFITVPPNVRQSEGGPVTVRSMLVDVRRGFAVVTRTRGLNLVFFTNLALNLLISGVVGLLLIVSTEKGFDIVQHGFFMTFYAVGGLIGSLFISAIRFSGRQRVFLAALGNVMLLVFCIVMLLSRSFWVISLCLLAAAAGNTVGNIVLDSSLLLMVPDGSRSTVFGIVMASAYGGGALSTVLYGVLAEYISLTVVGGAGMLLSFVPLVLLFGSREVRHDIETAGAEA